MTCPNHYLSLNSEIISEIPIFLKKHEIFVRGEYLCINKQKYFLNNELEQYVVDYLIQISNLVEESVWYRTADFIPSLMKYLDGHDGIVDEGGIISNRGVKHNILSKESFKREIQCIIRANSKCNNIILPYISTENELKEIINILNEEGYKGKIRIMVETPGIVQILDDILKKYDIDGVIIGLNDLTSLSLGVKRDSFFYDNVSDSIKKQVLYVNDVCAIFDKKCYIFGNITKKVIDVYSDLGLVNFIIHYHLIPEIFDEDSDKYDCHFRRMSKIFYEKRLKNS